MKKIQNLINKITLDKLTIIFLTIQPLLEIYYLYHFDGVKGLSTFSPSTIIRLILFLCIFIYFMAKNKIKDYKIPFIYGIIVLIYFIIHHLLVGNYTYLSDSKYSLVGELFYIVRLTLPILLIYVYYKSKYKDESIYNGVSKATIIFNVIMIITNIFMISFASYYSNFYEIETNIFGWLFASKNGYHFQQLATKGIFNMANCMSSMYVLIFILLLNKLKANKSNFNMLNIILLIISLYMLGTRTASYFPVIIMSATIIMLLVIKVLTKNKLDKLYLRKVLILLIVTLIILPIAPISHRSYDYEDNLNSEIDYNFESVEDKLADYKKQYDSGIYNKDEIVKFMRENSFSFLVHIEFLDAYRIEDDLEFWINYFMTDREIRGENRIIEKSIINRIKERNFETKHKLFGYTYTNTFGRGVIYERDFFAQYFYLGIIGVLLFLCPYVFICIYVGIISLKNIKKIDFETTMLLMGACITLVISILSGNSMEHFCVVIPLSIACGYMLKRVKKVY